MSECADGDNNHKCDVCGAQISQHRWSETTYRWSADGCTAVQHCTDCGENAETPVIFRISGETLTMSHVPAGLQLMIAGYHPNGKLVGCRLEAAAETISLTLPDAAEPVEQVLVFFLNGNWAPLRTPLPR